MVEDAFSKLAAIALSTPVVDTHTHIQDDLLDFDGPSPEQNLAGTQASFNTPSPEVVAMALQGRRLVRRTMMDATHALFYSWFAEIAEGSRGRLDEGIALLGENSTGERREAGRFLLSQLHDSRHSEYAEWLRFMFRLYDGIPADMDPLDPQNFDRVAEAVAAQRHDPEFVNGILTGHQVRAYVTSIENRDKLPYAPPIHPDQVDLGYATHSEAWSMFDSQGLLWPERASDFGLFTRGHKFQAERYLLHLEEYFGCSINSVAQLRDAVYTFFRRILRSPKSNPHSRILFVDGFQAEDWRFSHPYSRSAVAYAIRHHKDQLDGALRRQVICCVAEAMLEALNDIGREYKENADRFGCCLQLCAGATHFMDWSREVQSLPVYIPGLAQEEYPVWIRFPHVRFEYLCAHEGLYRDMANAAKQVGNVAVGPWWHFFRRHQMARMIRDQLTMGPISSIACGFTDARFVEMLAAKYHSLRLGIAEAVSHMVAEQSSSLYRNYDAAAQVIWELLLINPAAAHHIPLTRERELLNPQSC